ncbi:hypothetical protein F5883DRAFT_561912 [Diaporthe sp. PMI_573]|nr:hypothetical protein F5883DRAFT_561912 [Diaporthaceae sp. PMI_573]
MRKEHEPWNRGGCGSCHLCFARLPLGAGIFRRGDEPLRRRPRPSIITSDSRTDNHTASGRAVVSKPNLHGTMLDRTWRLGPPSRTPCCKFCSSLVLQPDFRRHLIHLETNPTGQAILIAQSMLRHAVARTDIFSFPSASSPSPSTSASTPWSHSIYPGLRRSIPGSCQALIAPRAKRNPIVNWPYGERHDATPSTVSPKSLVFVSCQLLPEALISQRRIPDRVGQSHIATIFDAKEVQQFREASVFFLRL